MISSLCASWLHEPSVGGVTGSGKISPELQNVFDLCKQYITENLTTVNCCQQICQPFSSIHLAHKYIYFYVFKFKEQHYLFCV